MNPVLLALVLLALPAVSGCAGVRPQAPPGGAASHGMRVEVEPVLHPGGASPQWWYRSGAARAAANGAMGGKARNVILFLGDGMSLTTVAAARILEGQRKGQPGEENQLAWEHFPHTALAKTYNTDSQTPDSAGTMTAIMSGVKSHRGAIGVAAGPRNDCATALAQPLLNWLQLADSAGLATGIVSTARLTHATPAATYANTPEREWESDGDLPASATAAGCTDIAQQLLTTARFGRGPRVALAGGRGEFMPAGQSDPEHPGKSGKRADGRDLIAEWQRLHPGGAYVWNSAQLRDAGGSGALLGLFEHDHMQYEHERDTGASGEPDLAELTRIAIDRLAREPAGYVLMIEGARVDHAHHDGNAFRALDETIAMSDAVRAAVEATSPADTLIIVTADHSHTLSFAGYPARGNPILGMVRGSPGEDGTAGRIARDRTGKPYTTLGYANGPGNTGASDRQDAGPKSFPHKPNSYQPALGRPDLTGVDTTDANYLQEALVPLKDESHGGDDVGVWAIGPGSEAVRGTIEQHVIYHLIVQATPALRERLCAADTCNAAGIPLELPVPRAFEK